MYIFMEYCVISNITTQNIVESINCIVSCIIRLRTICCVPNSLVGIHRDVALNISCKNTASHDKCICNAGWV